MNNTSPIRPRDLTDDRCETVDLNSISLRPSKTSFALRVTGDTLLARHICDGDILLLEQGPDPRHGQIVAALIDGKTVLRTFLRRNGRHHLKSEDPLNPSLTPAGEFAIQGVARLIIRQTQPAAPQLY